MLSSLVSRIGRISASLGRAASILAPAARYEPNPALDALFSHHRVDPDVEALCRRLRRDPPPPAKRYEASPRQNGAPIPRRPDGSSFFSKRGEPHDTHRI